MLTDLNVPIGSLGSKCGADKIELDEMTVELTSVKEAGNPILTVFGYAEVKAKELRMLYVNGRSPNTFFNRVRDLLDRVNTSAISLHQIGKVQLECVPENTFSRCVRLRRVDFGDVLGKVCSVSSGFLSECTSLKAVDLSSMKHIREVGANFLNRCVQLQEINLSPLRRITTIRSYFMNSCKALRSIDLSPLASVTRIENAFLYGCFNLKAIDLSPLSGVTYIGSHFLWECCGLTTLDIAPVCRNASYIGDRLLSGCSGLTAIDLTPLSAVANVGSFILEGAKVVDCTLPEMVSPNESGEVVSISDYFLFNCRHISSIDLSPLHNITVVASYFLAGCSNIASIDLSPFANVETISSGFLYCCVGILALDLTPFSNKLQTVHSKFLFGCRQLKTLDVSPLKRVSAIGPLFLEECSSLLTPTTDSVLDLTSLRGVPQYPTFFSQPVGCKTVAL